MRLFARLEPDRALDVSRRSGRTPQPQPAAAGRRPGAGVLAVRDAASCGSTTCRWSAATSYHAQAASQSVRDIVVQPQRGLIVDDMGRPLVANRTSWVV